MSQYSFLVPLTAEEILEYFVKPLQAVDSFDESTLSGSSSSFGAERRRVAFQLILTPQDNAVLSYVLLNETGVAIHRSEVLIRSREDLAIHANSVLQLLND